MNKREKAIRYFPSSVVITLGIVIIITTTQSDVEDHKKAAFIMGGLLFFLVGYVLTELAYIRIKIAECEE